MKRKITIREHIELLPYLYKAGQHPIMYPLLITTEAVKRCHQSLGGGMSEGNRQGHTHNISNTEREMYCLKERLIYNENLQKITTIFVDQQF